MKIIIKYIIILIASIFFISSSHAYDESIKLNRTNITEYSGEENIKVTDLTDSAVYKLRKHVEQVDDGSEADEDIGDDFENIYKGEISKSGTPILPSKRARKAPEKIQVSKDDLAELSQTAQPEVDTSGSDVLTNDEGDVSLEEVSDNENQESDVNTEDSEASNS